MPRKNVTGRLGLRIFGVLPIKRLSERWRELYESLFLDDMTRTEGVELISGSGPQGDPPVSRDGSVAAERRRGATTDGRVPMAIYRTYFGIDSHP